MCSLELKFYVDKVSPFHLKNGRKIILVDSLNISGDIFSFCAFNFKEAKVEVEVPGDQRRRISSLVKRDAATNGQTSIRRTTISSITLLSMEQRGLISVNNS